MDRNNRGGRKCTRPSSLGDRDAGVGLLADPGPPVSPSREEILAGIGYTPLTFPASLHVPEALRAKEERANQDHVVARVQGFWDFITKHEATQEPAAAGRQAGGATTREGISDAPWRQETAALNDRASAVQNDLWLWKDLDGVQRSLDEMGQDGWALVHCLNK